MQRIREIIVDNFAGGGGASTGIEMATGRSVDIAINHDPAAIAMHKANHPDTEHYCESVWDVDPREAVKGRSVALAWFSPDCFPAGTLVLTDKGYKEIETIQVGDMVLTHKQRWRRVTETSNTIRPLIEIRGHGHPGLKVSPEHPFYVKQRTNKWNNRIRQYRAEYSDADFVPASMLDKGWYWSTPTEIPALEIPKMVRNSTKGTTVPIDKRLMWLAGRYVGDGWTRLNETHGELVIICGKHEAEELRKKLDMWPRTGVRVVDGELSWNLREVRTAIQFTTNSRALVEWLRTHFGHGAEAKGLPAWLYGANHEFKQAFLEGYMSADGWNGRCVKGKEITEITTISRSLAFGIKQLITTMGFVGAVYRNDNPNKIIEGRTVNAKSSYKVRWRKEIEIGHAQTFIDEGLRFSPIRAQISTSDSEIVYNIGVDEDESYVAEGIVVHNCKHFSKAKGGKPVEKGIRGLAWVAVRWAATVKPRVIILENVEEFKTWGPLLENGQPDPRKKGRTFQSFINALKRHGYDVDHRELRACDYGAPTIRKRFFLIARRDGRPIVWPKPTHGDPKSDEVKSGKLMPWRTAAEIIDWSIPCPSIFERKKLLVENTMRRIARGLKKFVLDNPNPFIIKVNHAGEDFRGQEINKPLQTITAKNGWGVVTPFIARIGQTGFGGDRMQYQVEQPLTTVTTKAEHLLVTPIIARQFGNSVGHLVSEPLGTITASGGGKSQLVAAFLSKYYGVGIGQGCDEPLHTIPTKDRFGLVTIHGQDYQIVDIGMRMLEPRELFAAQGFPSNYIIDKDHEGKSYSKAAQVARCGNAVPPPFAEHLVRANLPELCTGSGNTLTFERYKESVGQLQFSM